MTEEILSQKKFTPLFGDCIFTPEEIARCTKIESQEILHSLEIIINADYPVLQLKKAGNKYFDYVSSSAIEPALLYFKKGNIPQRERMKQPASYDFSRETYGRMKELMSECIPLRDSIFQMENAIGLTQKEVSTVQEFMQQQEFATARIGNGRYTLSDIKGLNDKIKALKKRYAGVAGQIILENNGLIYKDVHKALRGRNIDVEELWNEGAEGIFNALRIYDPSYNVKFITFADHHIRARIGRYINNTYRMMRVPVHVSEKAPKLLKLQERIRREEGREMTERDVTKHFGKVVSNWQEHMQNYAPVRIIPLEGDEDDNYPQIDRIQQTCFENQENATSREELCAQVMLAMVELNEKEHRIVSKRFGLNGEKRMTLREVSVKEGLSRERIRQIEKQALMRLRSRAERDGLIEPKGESHSDKK